LVKPIIQSEKHIIQFTNTEVLVGTVSTVNIVSAVQNPEGSQSKEIDVGTLVKAIYIEVWAFGTGAQPPTYVFIVEKLPGVGQNITTSEISALHSYPNKKNIFYTSMGFLGDANTNPTPIIRQWILIPKGKQRMGLGDRFQWSIKSITEDLQFCGQCTLLAKS